MLSHQTSLVFVLEYHQVKILKPKISKQSVHDDFKVAIHLSYHCTTLCQRSECINLNEVTIYGCGFPALRIGGLLLRWGSERVLVELPVL